MGNLFVNIPVPAANGAGAAVDVSAMGATKSFVIGGGFRATVNVEYATDLAGTDWAPLATFYQSGNLTIDVAAHWLRAVTSDYVSGAPNLDVGANDAGSAFVQLPANGASTSIAALASIKTVVVPDGFVGTVDISEDGVSWAQIFNFTSSAPNGVTREVVGQFARVLGAVDGVAVPVYIGGAATSGGGGLATVSTDRTILGDGTPGDPLSVNNPARVYNYFNDFEGGANNEDWTVVVAGGATFSLATSQLPFVGCLLLSMNGTNDTGYMYRGTTQIELNEAAFSKLTIEWGGNVDLFGNQGSFCSRWLANSNMVPSLVGGNGNCLSFALGDDQNGNANWWGILDDATRYDLGVANDTNYHRFKIVYNAGVNVQWYIDDVLLATHVGSPSVAGQSVFVGMNSITGAVAGPAPTHVCDYLWIQMELPRP